MASSTIDRVIQDSKAYNCIGCGKCTAVCPINARDPGFSPRLVVEQVLQGNLDQLISSGQIWTCLTCGMCSQRCHAGVDYPLFVRLLRADASKGGNKCDSSHGGALHTVSRIMANPHLQQDRLHWLDSDLRTNADSDFIFFVGCTPYLDPVFRDIGARPLTSTSSALRLLNRLGIEPAILSGERCCGHDQLWTGDVEGFLKLARHNVEELTSTAAKTVLVSCPECYHTLKFQYPRYLGGSRFEVLHILQLLSQRMPEVRPSIGEMRKSVTFHDPCRLGRLSGLFAEPRGLLEMVPGLELREMPRNKHRSVCCGTHAWINCGAVSKQIQVDRLHEASTTGAELLVTACPKCEIHLNCASRGRYQGNGQQKGVDLEIVDVFSLLAEVIA